MDPAPVKSCLVDTMEQAIALTGSKELAKWWKQMNENSEIDSLILDLESLSMKPEQ